MSIPLKELKQLAASNELNGLYDVDERTYHHPECPGLSKTQISALLISKEHYQELLKNPPKQTPAMKFGSACHSAVLEPELFKERFVHYPNTPEFEGRSKAAIQAREKFDRVHRTKTILDIEDFQKIANILESVYSDSLAPKLLKGMKEKSFFWKDTVTGVLCKARPDCLNPEMKMIVDFKTISDSSREAFERSTANYGYHLQAAHYSEGVNLYLKEKIEDFVFVCVESKAPFKVKVRRLSDMAIKAGREQCQKALFIYKEASDSNAWKEETIIEESDLPQWAYGKLLDPQGEF